MNGNIEYFDYDFENNTNNSFVMYLGQDKDEVTGLYYNYNEEIDLTKHEVSYRIKNNKHITEG